MGENEIDVNENLKIEYISLDELKPYSKNARKHTPEDVQYIVNSIEEFGMCDPIGIWGKNNLVVEGHGRLLALKKLGYATAPCIRLDHLSDEQRRAYALAHNRTAEMSEWDGDILSGELEDIIGISMEDFGFDNMTQEEAEDELDDRYSAEIGKVTYEPKDTKHQIAELYEMTNRFDEMIEKLQNEELKEMLKIRVHWFCDFNFEKIADYYAYQATPEEQKVMEALALVLLDKDQLIENGFSDLMEVVDSNDDYE